MTGLNINAHTTAALLALASIANTNAICPCGSVCKKSPLSKAERKRRKKHRKMVDKSKKRNRK